MIRAAITAVVLSATVSFTRLRASAAPAMILRATPYLGRQVLSQDYVADGYFADDYVGSYAWVPA